MPRKKKRKPIAIRIHVDVPSEIEVDLSEYFDGVDYDEIAKDEIDLAIGWSVEEVYEDD